MKVDTQGLVPDPWLGEQLGRPAFHLADSVSPAAFPSMLDSVRGPLFVDAKAEVDDLSRVAGLTQYGFALADTSVILVRPPGAAAFGSAVESRHSLPSDRQAVGEIAARVFLHDRFHADPQIGGDAADRVKQVWACNYFDGRRGDAMVVGLLGGKVVGFLQLLHRDGHWVIDLVGVARAAQARGVGRSMVTYAINAIACGNAMKVGTQLRNATSLAFYQSLGFVHKMATHVLHWHAV